MDSSLRLPYNSVVIPTLGATLGPIFGRGPHRPDGHFNLLSVRGLPKEDYWADHASDRTGYVVTGWPHLSVKASKPGWVFLLPGNTTNHVLWAIPRDRRLFGVMICDERVRDIRPHTGADQNSGILGDLSSFLRRSF